MWRSLLLMVLTVLAACSSEAIGNAGVPGSVGDTGATGPAGMVGATGATGPAGAASVVQGTRITQRYIVTEDGLRTPWAGVFHDAQLNIDCIRQRTSDGKYRCVYGSTSALATANNGYFADSGCTQEVAFYSSACAEQPTVAFRGGGGDSCGTPGGNRYFALGTLRAAGSDVYTGTPGNCNLTTVLNSSNTWLLGAEIAPATFAEMTVE